METKAKVFFERLKGKKIAVIGVGVSHTDLIRMLHKKGLDVIVYDKRTAEQLGELYDEFHALGIPMELGPKYLFKLGGEDIIFRTPGMNYHTPELEMARRAGTVITSELEVFFDLCPCKIIGVTGSDGKTTTTTLIAKMLEAAGKTVHLGGNIGRALLPEIETVEATDYVVVELSSFQLISMRQSPNVAVITNISPNHLDVHKTMQEYIEAKCNIFAHQNGFSITVLNADDKISSKFAPLVRGRLNQFSRQSVVQRGAWMDENGTIWFSNNDSQTKIINASEIRLPGLHNVENYLAAFSAVWKIVPKEIMAKIAREFGGVEHRIEFVRELDGVRWYNDSIATSPTRTIAGLRSFDQKLVVIAGGYDKQIPFEPLVPELLEHVKTLILTGDTAPKIEALLRASPSFAASELTIVHADSLSDAVQQAATLAVEGDVVTLSPACASFDRYPNFEARGKHFKELVNDLSPKNERIDYHG
ncbi:MAG: UDP-N-acetylmuramoyl-L-alanine--D-glutamate ligase [Angelakisella sp.]